MRVLLLLTLCQASRSFAIARAHFPRVVAVRARNSNKLPDSRVVAVSLLRLGTACFPIANVVLAATGSMQVAQAFAVYAAIILAYIGGMQQSVALSEEKSPALVVAAICAALAAWGATICSILGRLDVAFSLLAALFAAQLALEESMLSSPQSDVVFLRPERRAPMIVASITLALAAVEQTLLAI